MWDGKEEMNVFRKLNEQETNLIDRLKESGRLPHNALPNNLWEVEIEIRRYGGSAQHGRETLPPALTVATLRFIASDDPEETSIYKIGASMRGFKDKENSSVGESVALVRAIRSQPVGLADAPEEIDAVRQA